MNVKNANYREIQIRWSAITLPLKEGSPIGLNGCVCNDGNAVGLVPQTVAVRPVTDTLRIVVGGDVELAEVEAAYGAALNTAAKTAMSGFRFFEADGTPYEPAGYTLPAATETAIGGVKMAANVPEIDTTGPADVDEVAGVVNGIIEALVASGAMAPPAED